MTVTKTATKTDSDKTPVAQDVFTYCTKEKIETFHVVMAHNASGIVERVKCKSCSSEHKYKRSNELLAKASGTPTRAVKKVGTPLVAATVKSTVLTSAQLEEVWLLGIKKWGKKDVTDFSPETSYGAGDVFTHSVFGKGVVQVRRETRVDVLFNVGLKTLPSKSALR